MLRILIFTAQRYAEPWMMQQAACISQLHAGAATMLPSLRCFGSSTEPAWQGSGEDRGGDPKSQARQQPTAVPLQGKLWRQWVEGKLEEQESSSSFASVEGGSVVGYALLAGCIMMHS